MVPPYITSIPTMTTGLLSGAKSKASPGGDPEEAPSPISNDVDLITKTEALGATWLGEMWYTSD
jgi:hypothetical protein